MDKLEIDSQITEDARSRGLTRDQLIQYYTDLTEGYLDLACNAGSSEPDFTEHYYSRARKFRELVRILSSPNSKGEGK